MQFYSHLSEDERDQLGIFRAARRGWSFAALNFHRAQTQACLIVTRLPAAMSTDTEHRQERSPLS